MKGVRALGTQWSTVLGAITTLVAFAGLVEADRELYGLTGTTRASYVVLAGGALVAAVVALLLAAKASGVVRLAFVRADVASRIKQRNETVEAAEAWLHGSRVLAVLAMLLLGLALYVRFFG